MKKLLTICTLSAVLFVGSIQAQAAENPNLQHKNAFVQQQKNRETFEQRLKLTDKQKEKAKNIHEKGASQMKPVMKKIGDLRNEIVEIKKSDLTEQAKQEKVSKKLQEIKKLDTKAREIRKQNNQEFENLLTDEQKVELQKMKAEGRKNFEKKHPARVPFNVGGPGGKQFGKQFPVPPANNK